MLTLVITAAVVAATVLTVMFGALLWRLAHGGKARAEARRGAARSVDREFRKIARRLGPLDPPDE